MIEYEEQQVKTLVPVKSICDRCGYEVKDYEDLIQLRHQYGYGSDKDGNYIEADICEDCFEDVVLAMDIKVRRFSEPNESEYDGAI